MVPQAEIFQCRPSRMICSTASHIGHIRILATFNPWQRVIIIKMKAGKLNSMILSIVRIFEILRMVALIALPKRVRLFSARDSDHRPWHVKEAFAKFRSKKTPVLIEKFAKSTGYLYMRFPSYF